MRALTLFVTFLVAVVAATSTTNVTYSLLYDEKALSTNGIACSNGANGLQTRFGFTTLGQLPTWPRVGGASVIKGWNSADCATCWNLSYHGTTITLTAIDTSPGEGFNIAEKAMNTLTNGKAVHLGKISVNFTQVAISACGLK